MLHAIKVTLRFLKKHLGFTIINVFGLSVGLAVCFMILNYIIHELSYDQFNEKKGRIYRVVLKTQTAGREVSAPFTIGALSIEARRQLPGVENAVRTYSFASFEIDKEDGRKFTNTKGIYIDSTFFQIFDYQLISGDRDDALVDPYSVVLTESLAQKVFGKKDPFMQSMKIDGDNYTITGVMKDPPLNSHLQFDLIASFTTICNPEYDITTRDGISFPTYLLLAESANPDSMGYRVDTLTMKLIDDLFGDFTIEVDSWLQSLNHIHLRSGYTFEYAKTSSISNIYIFSALAFFVILIAVINFINLSTVLYEKRSREIGIRKVAGAYRSSLARQFIFESVVVSLIAFVFSLVWVELLAERFSMLMNTTIPIIWWQSLAKLIAMILFVILVGVVSGAYPAFYLSGIRPISAIRGASQSGGKYTLRKVLVVFQFSISVFMIVILLLFYAQMSFVKNKELGFDKENVVVYQNFTEKLRNSYESLKTELEQIPQVISVTASNLVPGKERSSNNMVHKEGDDFDNSILININRVQHDYLETYGLELAAGRDFSKEYGLDTAKFILNEIAAEKLGLEDPVGKNIYEMDRKGRIIGVLKNYHVKSLHSPIEPLILKMSSHYFSYVSVRIVPGSTKESLQKIKEKIQAFDPAYETDYFFVDAAFQNLYDAENRSFRLFTYAAILAILISILGIFSLTALIMQKRRKEIGIRKTLGANAGSIVFLLLNSTTKWALIANLIAWPVAYYFMENWLQKFEYRIEIMHFWWFFLLAAALAYIQAVVTVIYQSVKAARTKPVDALRYE